MRSLGESPARARRAILAFPRAGRQDGGAVGPSLRRSGRSGPAATVGNDPSPRLHRHTAPVGDHCPRQVGCCLDRESTVPWSSWPGLTRPSLSRLAKRLAKKLAKRSGRQDRAIPGSGPGMTRLGLGKSVLGSPPIHRRPASPPLSTGDPPRYGAGDGVPPAQPLCSGPAGRPAPAGGWDMRAGTGQEAKATRWSRPAARLDARRRAVARRLQGPDVAVRPSAGRA